MRFPIHLVEYNGDLPTGLLALARRLEAGGEFAPAQILGPATALTDLRTVAESVLVGKGPLSGDDRASVRNDVRVMIDALGPAVRDAATTSWDALRQELGRMPQLLESPDGALMIVGLVDAVFVKLASRPLSLAAWADVRAAFESDAVSASICELRILQFAEFVRQRGGDWRATATEVSAILRDDTAVLTRRGLVEEPAAEGQWQAPAGVSLDKRLAVAEEAIGDDPPHGEMIGWVCFAQAWVPEQYLDVGGVEFYSDQAWPDGIRHGWAQNASSHDEFDDQWHTIFFRTLPEAPFVLAAVPLDHGPIAGAVDRARAIAQQLVSAARPHSMWKLVPGAAIYVLGEDAGWFGLPFDRHDRPDPPSGVPQYEPSGRELEALKPAIAKAVIQGTPSVQAAVRDAEWSEAVADLPDARQRLALGLRLVERCLPSPAGDRWTASVSRYLKEWWIDHETRELIGDVAISSVDALGTPPGIGGPANSWRERLTPSSGGLPSVIRLDETLRATAELLDALPAGSMQHRQVGELATHSTSAEAWLEFMAVTGQAFDLLIDRAARQRNAIVHGADTVDGAIQTVSDFAALLQSMLVHDQIAAFGAEESLLARLEQRRISLEQKRTRLLAGEPLIDSILRPGGPKPDEPDPGT